eukprot:6189625-Alexandrium_andersonii.AAC.1
MSASLVGSEMCIRDRGRGCSPSRVPALSGLLPSGSSFAGESAPVPSPNAVSYTHLTLPTICSV